MRDRHHLIQFLFHLILFLFHSYFIFKLFSHFILGTGELVAIKKLYFNSKGDGPISLPIMREIMCLHHCKHDNIIALKEVLVTKSKYNQTKISIVTELCELDLHSMLKKR
jgi:serine/threonine protein kinase